MGSEHSIRLLVKSIYQDSNTLLLGKRINTVNTNLQIDLELQKNFKCACITKTAGENNIPGFKYVSYLSKGF